jgi:hypothetical protein
LLEQRVEFQLVLVRKYRVACLSWMEDELRTGGSSLMYLRAASNVACIMKSQLKNISIRMMLFENKDRILSLRENQIFSWRLSCSFISCIPLQWSGHRSWHWRSVFGRSRDRITRRFPLSRSPAAGLRDATRCGRMDRNPTLPCRCQPRAPILTWRRSN